MPLVEKLALVAATELIKQSISKTSAYLTSKKQEYDADRRAIFISEEYLNRILKEYNTLRILGADEPIPLNDVYINLLLAGRVKSRQTPNVLALNKEMEIRAGRISRDDGSRESIEVFDELHNMAVLGRPGSGKSTFLKKLLIESVSGRLVAKRLPVLISLRAISESSKHIVSCITNEMRTNEFGDDLTKELLASGRLLVLLDGLDEVPEAEFSEIIEDINQLARNYNTTRFIVSCRGAAYSGQLPNFTDVEIADFTQDQIAAYAQLYFHRDEKRKQLFLAKVLSNSAALELCSTPLLLSMICLIFLDTGEIERRRALIYSEAVEALLKRWDNTKTIDRNNEYRFLSKKRKIDLLNTLAIRYFERNQHFFEMSEVSRYIESFVRRFKTGPEPIDGVSIVKTIEVQHGFLAERAKGVYSFSHLTFQEYFVAQWLQTRGQDKLDLLIKEHVGDFRWREVILLVGDLLGFREADRYLLMILNKLSLLVSIEPISLKKFREQSSMEDKSATSLFDDEVDKEQDIRERFRLALGTSQGPDIQEIRGLRQQLGKMRWGKDRSPPDVINGHTSFLIYLLHRIMNVPFPLGTQPNPTLLPVELQTHRQRLLKELLRQTTSAADRLQKYNFQNFQHDLKSDNSTIKNTIKAMKSSAREIDAEFAMESFLRINSESYTNLQDIEKGSLRDHLDSIIASVAFDGDQEECNDIGNMEARYEKFRSSIIELTKNISKKFAELVEIDGELSTLTALKWLAVHELIFMKRNDIENIKLSELRITAELMAARYSSNALAPYVKAINIQEMQKNKGEKIEESFYVVVQGSPACRLIEKSEALWRVLLPAEMDERHKLLDDHQANYHFDNNQDDDSFERYLSVLLDPDVSIRVKARIRMLLSDRHLRSMKLDHLSDALEKFGVPREAGNHNGVFKFYSSREYNVSVNEGYLPTELEALVIRHLVEQVERHLSAYDIPEPMVRNALSSLEYEIRFFFSSADQEIYLCDLILAMISSDRDFSVHAKEAACALVMNCIEETTPDPGKPPKSKREEIVRTRTRV